MKRKSLLVICTLALLCLIVWAGIWCFRIMNKQTLETQHYSAMSWLNLAVAEALQDHYKAHGRYPNQLNDLPIPFPGDGATQEMLNEFEYETDGETYTVMWKINYGGSTHIHKQYGSAGKNWVMNKEAFSE